MAEVKHEPAFIKLVITEDVYAQLDQFKKDWAGHDPVDVKIRVETGNGQAKELELSMSEFLEAMGLEEADELIKPCEECGGIGEHLEVATDESDGEGHTMRGVGSAMCSQAPEPDYERDDE